VSERRAAPISATGIVRATITSVATGSGSASSESRTTPVSTAEALRQPRTLRPLDGDGRSENRARESAEPASARVVAPNAITRYTVIGWEYSHDDPAHAESMVAPTTAPGITAR